MLTSLPLCLRNWTKLALKIFKANVAPETLSTTMKNSPQQFQNIKKPSINKHHSRLWNTCMRNNI